MDALQFAGNIPFDQLVQQLVVPAFVIGADGRVLVWNRACEVLTGRTAEQVVGTSEHWRAFYFEKRPCLADLILLGALERVSELYAAHDGSSTLYGGLHVENWCAMPLRGIDRYLSIDAGPIVDTQGKLIAVVETLHDRTDWKNAEIQLHLSDSVFASSSEGIIVTDVNSLIVKVNPAYTSLTGYMLEDVLGHTPRLLRSGIHDQAFYDEMWQTIAETGQWQGEIWNRRKNGELFPGNLAISCVRGADAQVTHYVGMLSDITQQKQDRDRLEDMATHDALTGLPNRISLSIKLHQALVNARNHNRLVAVCFVDLDGFKPVNDQYGHETGDRVLIEIANRIKHAIRASDSVARIGGDEFVILLAEFANIDEIEIAIERILDMLRQPVHIEGDGLQIKVSASIGVTVHPFDESDADTLIRHADQAMYIAKNQGRNNWRMYDSTDDKATHEISSMLGRVRDGLEQGEFRLHYQPKVNLRTGEIIGMEALIRWQHPERGMVPPGSFLPQVENSPVIVDIGEWVIETALGQIAHWLANGLQLVVSVNIAARQFQHIDFVMRLRSILARFPQVPPSLLEIEVLESTALDDVENVRAVILACQSMGVGFALDDFGTGYSTLTYLKRLPARTLKIDQTFIRDMLDDKEDLALIEGVIGLADVFHMDVIAEGVETIEQGIVLMRIGCDVVQGYYVARPMPAEQVQGWCATFVPPPAWAQWAKAAWDRTHLPLVLAGFDHLKWVQRLLQALDDETIELNMQELADPRACRFGQWYDTAGKRQYGHLPAFMAIDDFHGRMHTLADELVRQRDGGDHAGAQERKAELIYLKDEIVTRLDTLHDHLRQSH